VVRGGRGCKRQRRVVEAGAVALATACGGACSLPPLW
jgi:hypothetical protein